MGVGVCDVGVAAVAAVDVDPDLARDHDASVGVGVRPPSRLVENTWPLLRLLGVAVSSTGGRSACIVVVCVCACACACAGE